MRSPVSPAAVAHRYGGADHPASIRVGVVDSDSGFVRVLVKRLDDAGWHHRVADAVPAPEELARMRLNALVVDLRVAGEGAWEYLDRVVQVLPTVAVVVCTGRSSVAQRVHGLRAGADDWITKPCHPEEVVARIEAAVRRRRRAAPRTDARPLVTEELEIRADRFEAFACGRGANLTRREFELLELLAGAEGQVLEREEIYQRVWGYEMARGDRSVDVFVRKLREKLRRISPDWAYIHTHFGVGYRFQPEPVRDAGGGDPSPEPQAATDRALAEPAPGV